MLNPDDLQFHEGAGETTKVANVYETSGPGSRTYHFNHENDPANDEIEDGATGKMESQKAPSKFSMLSFDFFQKYFDIDTDQVLRRMLHSMIPRVGVNFIETHIRPMPDMYGPFWICATLVVAIGLTGNIFEYFKSASADYDFHWTYDFHMVTVGGAVIFSYVWLLPAFLYAFLWYRRSESAYSYTELLSLYGYSMTPFVVVSLFWIIPSSILQWILIGVSAFISGAVIAFSVYPALRNENHLLVVALISMAVILGLHALLAISFKMYFFSSSIPLDTESHHAAAHVDTKGSSVTNGDQLKNETERSSKDFVTTLVTTLTSGNGTH